MRYWYTKAVLPNQVAHHDHWHCTCSLCMARAVEGDLMFQAYCLNKVITGPRKYWPTMIIERSYWNPNGIHHQKERYISIHVGYWLPFLSHYTVLNYPNHQPPWNGLYIIVPRGGLCLELMSYRWVDPYHIFCNHHATPWATVINQAICHHVQLKTIISSLGHQWTQPQFWFTIS